MITVKLNMWKIRESVLYEPGIVSQLNTCCAVPLLNGRGRTLVLQNNTQQYSFNFYYSTFLPMCNCGKKRNELHQQQRHIPADTNAQQSITAELIFIHFEYTGKSGLTVTGNITGTRYRFNYPGEIIPIDKRDAAGMMGVPVLSRR